MGKVEELLPNCERFDVALRSIGYSFEAAVADVIDNSLDAGAQSIRVRLIVRKDELLDLAIVDDGEGMSSATLKEAMRFGSDLTQELDRLGKFGIGLKLASLSQAKELAVVSYRHGSVTGRAWPENGIRDGFRCKVFTQAECESTIHHFLPDIRWRAPGTLVCWSGLYRVGSDASTVSEHVQGLLRRLRNYLALAFHRFLARKSRPVAIMLEAIDGDVVEAGIPIPLEPLDPFGYVRSGQNGFPATLDVADGYASSITLRAHIWPPNSDSSNYKLPGGANSRQGFYFYRNDRLIQGGGWNGLRETENHFSLARIEVDVAPGFDVQSSLDVKKSDIQLPAALRKAIQASRTSTGIDFKGYLRLAEETYRTRPVLNEDLPLVPSTGIPRELRAFLREELRLESTSKCRELEIVWARLPREELFSFDRDSARLSLNKAFRSQLLHGRKSSATDLPFVKCLLFLLLEDLIASQRTGKKMREAAERLNRILVKAVKFEFPR